MAEPVTEAKYKKAGMVIYGTLARGPSKGQRALVAPYNEGRFGDRHKYYALPKGSIDPGETTLQAALRETQEETGIDMEKLLTPEGVAKLARGEALKNVRSGYPGVTILRAEPQPMDHTYLSRANKNRRLAFYGVEIAGIDKLHDALKNQQNCNRNGGIEQVHYSIRDEIAADAARYPMFEDLIEWLRHGQMPERAWNSEYAGDRALPASSQNGAWFQALEREYGPIHTQHAPLDAKSGWQKFCQNISGADYSILKTHIDAMKRQLKAMHILNGDNGHIKLDDKDCPLNYYQEGADIITTQQYLHSCFERMHANPDYAMAFGGDCELLKDYLPSQRIKHSQLVAIAPFISKEDIATAAASFTRDRDSAVNARIYGKKPSIYWGAPPSGQFLSKPMLAVREEMKKDWRIRTKNGGETVIALG